jgi:hypothetical protein
LFTIITYIYLSKIFKMLERLALVPFITL